MTIKEWVKEYPEIAASLFNCSVDDLDNVLDNILDEESDNTDIDRYLTKEQTDKLIEIILNT